MLRDWQTDLNAMAHQVSNDHTHTGIALIFDMVPHASFHPPTTGGNSPT